MCNKQLSTNAIKGIKYIFIVFLLLIISTIKESSSFDPTINDWYSVEPWELEVCSKWGGTEEVASGATSSKPVYLSQTTLSLQGKKQSYNIDGFNKTLFAVSWYFEPMSQVGYRLEMLNDDGSEVLKIGDGDASYASPAVGYHSEYYDIDYTAVRLIYGTDWIKVPLVELK